MSTNQKCSDVEIDTLDGKCCLEKCETKGGKSSAWIGYVLLGVIILILTYMYVKYKKVKPEKNIIEKVESEPNPNVIRPRDLPREGKKIP